jgi:hypothetical protein
MAAGPGDLLVITPTDVTGSWNQVLNFRDAESAGQRRGSIAAE